MLGLINKLRSLSFSCIIKHTGVSIYFWKWQTWSFSISCLKFCFFSVPLRSTLRIALITLLSFQIWEMMPFSYLLVDLKNTSLLTLLLIWLILWGTTSLCPNLFHCWELLLIKLNKSSWLLENKSSFNFIVDGAFNIAHWSDFVNVWYIIKIRSFLFNSLLVLLFYNWEWLVLGLIINFYHKTYWG